jgi:hypothetical protein
VYVYGVVRNGAVDAFPEEGVARAPVRLLAAGDVAAVVSPLPTESLRVRRRDLHLHLGVLEAVFSETTIVPCSFGTVLASAEVVTSEFLGERRGELLHLLARLEGRAQLNVKASYDGEGVLREIVAGELEIARLRQRSRALGDAAYYDNLRLGELVAMALEARRRRDSARILEQLAGRAEDVSVEESDGDVALKASFLVDRDRLRPFDEALDELARDEAPLLRFESFGPLPPTAFASLGAQS